MVQIVLFSVALAFWSGCLLPCDDSRFLIKIMINFVFMFSSALQSIFISRITEGGAADRIGVLLVGDKVMEVSESR